MFKRRKSALLSLHDLVNLSSLVGKLTPQDALSDFLWARFSTESKTLLTHPDSTKQKQQTALIEELNKVISGPSIYEEKRFAKIRLSPKTNKCRLESQDVLRLNRCLLEDAYPLELRRTRDFGEALKEQWPFVLWVIIFLFVIAFGVIGPCLITYLPWTFDWPHFWHYWEVGALVSTAFYNLLFYVVGFFKSPRMFLHLEKSYIGLIPILCGFAVALLIAATIVSIMDRPGWLQLLLIFLGTAFFWAVDRTMAQHSMIETVRQDFDASVRLNDNPALVAFGVLFVFAVVYPLKAQSGAYDAVFRAFMGGAVAFQMIASNWALALIFRKPGEPVGATD
jgi:hypothetical protein